MTCCTYLSRGKQFSGCVRIFFLYAIFSCFAAVCEMRPIPGRWVNPCALNSPLEYTARNNLGYKAHFLKDICQDIAHWTEVAYTQAGRVLNDYVIKILNAVNYLDLSKEIPIKVEESFKDKSFIEGTASHRLNWLPKVNPSDVEEITFDDALPYFYMVVQYYGVGLEQIYTDEIVNDGKYFGTFQEVENNMAQLLCTLQTSMANVGIQPNPDVLRDVMLHQYRWLTSHTQRLIRNYLILRDYKHTLGVMMNTFKDLKEKQERTLSEDPASAEPKTR